MNLLQSAEIEANLLRRCLQSPVPEHRILCILRFFDRLQSSAAALRYPTLVEGYLREFMPALATAARIADPYDLLQHEQVQLGALSRLLRQEADRLLAADDSEAIARYQDRARSHTTRVPAIESKVETFLAGLFVEDVPELELAPRGRLLWLGVRVSEADSDETKDILHIFNPHAHTDGPLVQQAEIAIGAARSYLRRHYGLSMDRRYRVDFRVLPVTSRITGNSLGIAFTVGAVIAIARREVLRELLSVQPSVAFTGAVGENGSVESIDGEGLRLKIERAYHNRLNYLTIPRAHLAEAYETVSELEKQAPGHTLNIVGADSVDAVLNDRNLINRQRRTFAGYTAGKTRKTLNRPKVGLPILASLLIILAFLARPWLQSHLDSNPASVEIKGKGILVKNQHGRTLWTKEYRCDSLTHEARPWTICDLDGDALNEVLIIPPTDRASPDNANLFVYEHDGTPRFVRTCSIWDQYPGDDVPGGRYQADAVHVVANSDGPIIVTLVSASNPSRSHIRTWTSSGDSTGWFINPGTAKFEFAWDFDGNGRQDLFFTGFNIRVSATTLFVIRAKGSEGAGPPYSDSQYDLSEVLAGNQLHYMIFPQTDLGAVLGRPYNAPRGARCESNSSFRLDVAEDNDPTDPILAIYYLDRALRVERAEVCDRFKTKRQSAVLDGRLPVVDPAAYLTHLRDTVAHWTSIGWVTEGRLSSSR